MDRIELIITADTNDADYVTKISIITKEQEDRIKPVIAAIQNIPNHNWCTSEYAQEATPEIMYNSFSPELIEEFDDFVPYGEYGVHTIQSIKVRKIKIIEEYGFSKR